MTLPSVAPKEDAHTTLINKNNAPVMADGWVPVVISVSQKIYSYFEIKEKIDVALSFIYP